MPTKPLIAVMNLAYQFPFPDAAKVFISSPIPSFPLPLQTPPPLLHSDFHPAGHIASVTAVPPPGHVNKYLLMTDKDFCEVEKTC